MKYFLRSFFVLFVVFSNQAIAQTASNEPECSVASDLDSSKTSDSYFRVVYNNTLAPLPMELRLCVLLAPYFFLGFFSQNPFTQFASLSSATLSGGLSWYLFKNPPQKKENENVDPSYVPTLLALILTPYVIGVFHVLDYMHAPPVAEGVPIVSLFGAQEIARTLINLAPAVIFESAPECILCMGEFTVENSAVLFSCGHSLIHTHEIADECGGLQKFLELYNKCPMCAQVVAQ